MPLTLTSSIKEIHKVGVATARQFKNLNIETVEDLLHFFPFRYDDFSIVTPINTLQAGINANIVGHVELIQNKRSPRQRINITEALVADETGSVKIIWFNQPFIGRTLQAGDKVSLSGTVSEDYSGAFLKAPNYEKIGQGKGAHTQGLVPNYSLTAGLTQKQLRFLITQVIQLKEKVVDWLPVEIKTNLDLFDLQDAIQNIHFPQNKTSLDKARKRLSLDELFLIQLRSQLIRKDAAQCVSASIKFKEDETKEFVKNLPFELTRDQKITTWKILQDMEKEKPMARLLEGDVGSGKTMVAIIAMLNAALNKKQSVLMVPTEILAKQHFAGVCKFFEKTEIKIGLVTNADKRINYELEVKRDDKKKKQKKMDANLIIQNSDIIIGTHSLIQNDIKFKDLGLAIIDEQHRFGVGQRQKLTEGSRPHPNPPLSKGREIDMSPHLLSMTATPIPRSLALALYGDLDVSIIREMPKGRKPITTKIVLEGERDDCYKFVRESIQAGRQVFVVCPLIDVSDKLGVKSVKEEFERLNNIVFKDLEIAMLHGKMKPKEKEEIMAKFLENKIKILVSTSVIEVGVDVPNASIMIIEGADRFGLAQLHQFRGRVGRGEYQSHCFLFSESNSQKTVERLNALVNSNDGFALAQADLELRGPGEVYGTMQKGFLELKMASLFDYNLMQQAKDEIEKLFKEDLSLDKWPALKQKADEMQRGMHLE